MHADEFRDAVTAEARTQLDRIGSSKLLVALTDADLTDAAVLAVAADSEAAAAEVFDAWSADAATDELASTYAETAAAERDHLARVLAELDDYEPAGRGGVHDHLLEQTHPIDRLAAGYVGRGLLAMRTHTQLVSYFVNEQDRRRAELFRELKADTAEQLATGTTLLGDHCGDDADWERALDAATAVVDVAYEEYVAALDGMGIDPKSLC